MIDTDKYEGHLASEGQTWAWSKWMLKNAETIQQHEATAALLKDAPLLLVEVERLREGIKAYLQIIDERPPFNVDYREKLRELIE
tara:strand:- start:462 stop:716 length:255 start_codon:yes stop_codon:yes gene_type:complete